MQGSIAELVASWEKEKSFLLGSPIHLFAARYIACSVLHTLDALNNKSVESQNLIHLDIKPENIALDLLLQVRIVDFGTSVMLRDTRTSTTNHSHKGTLMYQAPELQGVTGPTVLRTSDLYSFGLLLRYLMDGCSVPKWTLQQNTHRENTETPFRCCGNESADVSGSTLTMRIKTY